MVKRLTRSVRLAKLKEYLSLKTPGGGVTVKNIADHCGVTTRQIYRDLDTLEEDLGIKVLRPDRGQRQKGKYKLEEGGSLKIGPEEAAVIFLSILKQKGNPLAYKTNQIKDLLIASLFNNRFSGNIEELDKLKSRVYTFEEELLDLTKAGSVLLRLMEAIKDNKLINIKYFNPTKKEKSIRFIEPYGLVSKNNAWYLFGYCRESKDKRTFRVDLIERVSVQSSKFQYPQDFSLEGYFNKGWGIFTGDDVKEVKIKVGPEIAYRFKLISYHSSQKIIEEYEDGSIIVSYQTSSLSEFTAWLFQWAELVEVLEPQEMREIIKEKLQKLLFKYT